MPKEKEKLTEAQEQDTDVEAQEQDNIEQEDEGEDLFNPFADVDDEEEVVEEQEEEDDDTKKEDIKEEKSEPVEDKKARARLDAIEAVDEYLEENPDYDLVKKELREYTAKAIERGHKNPVEFALRNAKSPSYWMKLGEQRAREAIESGKSTTLRGSSASAGAGNKSQDFASMPKSDFNAMVEQVKRSR
jgi:hypothetical protein